MANLGCQLDYFCNQLESKELGMPVIFLIVSLEVGDIPSICATPSGGSLRKGHGKGNLLPFP